MLPSLKTISTKVEMVQPCYQIVLMVHRISGTKEIPVEQKAPWTTISNDTAAPNYYDIINGEGA